MKIKSHPNFGNYLVNVQHVSALQGHHQVPVFTKILRRLGITQQNLFTSKNNPRCYSTSSIEVKNFLTCTKTKRQEIIIHNF
jgi:hypothetical protein